MSLLRLLNLLTKKIDFTAAQIAQIGGKLYALYTLILGLFIIYLPPMVGKGES